jgi:hypothetical protein
VDSKLVCLHLLAAESEKAVQQIIDSVPEMRDTANWAAIDARETNFNVVTNQASTGGKAATELMTNMVDAILMRRAYELGIDPRDRSQAPCTMYEAVDRFIVNLRGGRLVNADESWLQDFAAKNLVVSITGSRETTRKGPEWPCYTFVDNGEGQHPANFKTTFLSLSARNKSGIPFVQGKYNMGSSGVLAYCGTKWFKLIVSRRYDATGPWGWTLIRRRPGEGMPIADYFHVDGQIPSFEADALYPLHKNTGARFEGVMLRTGTIVKLYDFRVGEKFKSFRGAREAFNENLVETILPFRILDFRWTPDPKRGGLRAEGIDARPFYGMECILRRRDDDDDDDSEQQGTGAAIAERFQVGAIDDPELGRIEITAIPLRSRPDGKDPLPGWLKPTSSNSRVFHAVNGQVQFKQTRGYLSICGFSGIKDRVVVIVDASGLAEGTHFSLWKGDRENIIQNATGERYLAVVRSLIEDSPSLDDWKQQVAREDLKRIASEDTNDLFQKLVNSDRELIALLDRRDPTLRLPDTKEDEEEFEGRYDPTFLILDSRFSAGPIDVPLDRTRAVAGTTDAVNDFFIRADNRGQLYISEDAVRKRFSVKRILYNGRLTVFFEPVSDSLQAGDLFEFELGLVSSSMPEPLTQLVTLRIAPEEGEPKPRPWKRREKKPEPEEEPKRGLPPYVLLTKDGRDVLGQHTVAWPEDFSELDGGRVTGEDDRPIYEINVDNAYHLRYRRRAKTDVERDLLTQKYITGMRLFLLGFENSRRNVTAARNGANGSGRLDDVADDFRTIAARGAASVVLWLTDQLPKIVNLPDESVE